MTFQAVNEVRDAKAARKARQAFYTPLVLVERLIEWADLYPSARALEPSAGDGRIAHAMLAAGVEKVDACETDDAMAIRLSSLGVDVVARDFLAFKPMAPYDRIVMNPPFSRGLWKRHLKHAASMLAPDGRLLCIVPKQSQAEFVTESIDMGGCDEVTCEALGDKWFKEFGTSITVELVEAIRHREKRECNGFSNLQTFNVAIGLESDADAMELITRASTRAEIKDVARRMLYRESSFYGVDWSEVTDHLCSIAAGEVRRPETQNGLFDADAGSRMTETQNRKEIA